MSTSQAKIVVSAEDRASRVLGQVRTQMAAAGDSAGQLAASAGLIGPAFATLASAAGLVAFVKHVVDAVDALNDVADATGASIESLSALERVARLNGGTLDDVSGILVKFNAALNQAADPRSDAAGVFKALGLSVKELQALDPAEALQRVAVSLQGFAADGNKARVVQELFGKSIKAAAPYLKDLAEAGKVNATVTREQAEQAERFNKVLFAMQVASDDTRRALVDRLGTGLIELIERFKTASTVFGGLGGILSAGLMQKLNFSDPAEGLRQYNGQLAELDARIKAATSGSDGGLAATSGLRIQRLQKEREEIAKVADYYRTLVNAGGAGAGRGNGPPTALPRLPAKPSPAAVAPKLEIDESARALAAYVQQLDKESTKLDDLTTQQEALIELRRLGALGEVDQVREVVLGLAKKVDAQKDSVELEKAITAELQRQAQARQVLDDAIDRFSGRTEDALKRAQTSRLEQRLAAGEAFSPEELDRTVKGIAGIKDESEKTFDAAGKALERFTQNVQDAFGDTLEATLRGDFDSIGKLWGNLIIKMISQAVAADLAKALFGDLLTGGKSGGSVAGGVLSAGLGFLFGPGRAGGGPVGAMSVQRVNENGFEVFSQGGRDWLMTGSQGGYVTPNHQLQAPAGPAQVTNINVASGMGRGEVLAAIQMAVRASTSSIYADLRQRRVLS